MSSEWPPQDQPDPWAPRGRGDVPDGPGRPPPGGWSPPGGYPAPGGGPIPARIGRGAGPVPLRPLNVGDFLDGMFKLLIANARALLLIAALFAVPVQLLAAYLQRDLLSVGLFDALSAPETFAPVESQTLPAGTFAAAGVALVASGLVLPFIAGAAARLVASSYLGQPLQWSAALRQAGRQWGALLGAWWLHVLAYLLPVAPGGALLIVGATTGGTGLLLLAGLLTALGVLVAVLMVPLFVGSAPAIVTEGLRAAQSLQRSARLVRQRYWPTLGVIALTGIIISVIAGLLSAVPSVAAQLVGGRWAWVLAALGQIISNLVTLPLVAIVATLVYFDGRIRHEGFDLQLLAAELARPGGGAAGGAWERGSVGAGGGAWERGSGDAWERGSGDAWERGSGDAWEGRDGGDPWSDR